MYSSICVFVLVLYVVSTKAENSWVRWSSTMDPLPPDKRPLNDVVNIGNGVDKHNVVILNQHENGSTRNIQRFSDDFNPNNQQNPEQHRLSAVNNIGNGFGNKNTVMISNGDRRTIVSQDDDATNRNTERSFTTSSHSGVDQFNVGYGSNNHNRILVNGKPIQPDSTDSRGSTYHIQRENTRGAGETVEVLHTDCYGTSCDKRMYNRRVANNSEQTNPSILLVLTFVTCMGFFQLKPY